MSLLWPSHVGILITRRLDDVERVRQRSPWQRPVKDHIKMNLRREAVQHLSEKGPKPENGRPLLEIMYAMGIELEEVKNM